jgi:hypothetical protein
MSPSHRLCSSSGPGFTFQPGAGLSY